MKKALLAALALSVVTLAARSYFSRPRVNDAGGSATAAIDEPIPAGPARNPNAVPDSISPVATIPSPQPVSPSAQSGAVVSIPGIAPLLLGSRAGAPWEDTVEKLANRTDLPDKIKARFLIQMLPGLPPEVIAKAADEAVSRVADSDYREIVLPSLKNPATHGMGMNVLFADLMQRPAAISLPILLTIAQDGNHPFSPFARDNLGLLLDRDLGSDWEKWNQAIQVHLGTSKK